MDFTSLLAISSIFYSPGAPYSISVEEIYALAELSTRLWWMRHCARWERKLGSSIPRWPDRLFHAGW